MSPARCPQCGGSGMLRIDDQRYRTCLDCLGQGRLATITGEGLLLTLLKARSVSGAR